MLLVPEAFAIQFHRLGWLAGAFVMVMVVRFLGFVLAVTRARHQYSDRVCRRAGSEASWRFAAFTVMAAAFGATDAKHAGRARWSGGRICTTLDRAQTCRVW